MCVTTTGAPKTVTSGSIETTETTESTETTETTETSEGVSRDSSKVTGVVAGAISAAGVIGSAVSATRSTTTTSADVGSNETTQVTETTETVTGEGVVLKSRLGNGDDHEKTLVVLGLGNKDGKDSKLRKVKEVSFEWSWLTQFVRFCEKRGKVMSNLAPEEVRELARDFCAQSFTSFSENLFESGSLDEKRAAWNVSYALSVHFPELAVHQFGADFGQHKRVVVIDEASSDDKKVSDVATTEVLASMLKSSPKLSGDYENVLITEGGETVFYGSAKSLRAFFQEFGFDQSSDSDITQFLLGLSSNTNAQYEVTVIDDANQDKESQRIQRLSSFVSFADDSVLFSGTSISETNKKYHDETQSSQKQQTTTPKTGVSSSEESGAAVAATATAAMSSLSAT
ncbi:unnamed protein product [Phytophthora fragariaefolia]|uniref:Unnamed protein product n=1 Tax=Phytophthora fragariaefolia TaxID=1490495 RepID=A0A9W7CJ46_9STRA|nr:unnamed protein product [Phytophthora fragariaefolia]